MKDILSWAVPPLIGAVIGYVTNAIAIKMLFRPLKELRLFARRGGRGIRVPFTPGILPRERRRLAESIGAMVERELLTAEIVRERLGREGVRESAGKFVARITGEFLGRPLSGLKDAAARSGLGPLAESLGDKVWPALADMVTAFLRKPGIHAELEQQGKKLVERVMDRLSTFQRFFVEAGNYDLTIQDQMPEIIDDFIRRVDALLRDGTLRDRIALAGPGGRSLGEMLGLDGAAKDDLDAALCGRLLDAAGGHVEAALEAIDVKAMVEDRINSLEMIQVEKIVLDVMADQFKWINLFGGILGALIGIMEALFSHFVQRF